MTIELSYRYSELDNTYCFGVVFDYPENYEAYVRWIWYYLGQELIKVPKNFRLYPFRSTNKVLKNYKHLNDAKRQAVVLGNAIKRRMH